MPDGVYIYTGDKHASYIVHLHAGTAEVVARHLDRNKGGCQVPSRPVDAMNLSCDLSWIMAAYRPGSLVMAGADFILQIATRGRSRSRQRRRTALRLRSTCGTTS